MPIRKSAMREQVAQAITQINPADPAIVTLHCITGPSPWLMSPLGSIGQLFVTYYFITVTDQAVIFHKAGRVSNRPKDLVAVIPRAEAQTLISDVRRNTLWSSFRFQLPGEPKPTRINIARSWRPEMDRLLAALTGTA